MTYRFLGNFGLLVSKMALGSWMISNDNAEVYGNCKAEEFMDAAIQRGIADGMWTREDLRKSSGPLSSHPFGCLTE
ncbi:hypothetical protein GN244_ATG20003 [Phytophthora infestans]|uniref:NADP-dependent oxidoreductase domain-containing protein n=1 Tax=Phytophthora infestans TaxID=4787 RepID=A0A833RY23_PHYIN|nr:hypothetical protein GN244_ATG20003 [Phytophthora infestans]KAF4143779.1 hypothetical protein GN958_ATG07031 [Phytophthora infestans]KAI9986209.1 hypothetical protein PInf_025128 [Phytophthora infestans]